MPLSLQEQCAMPDFHLYRQARCPVSFRLLSLCREWLTLEYLFPTFQGVWSINHDTSKEGFLSFFPILCSFFDGFPPLKPQWIKERDEAGRPKKVALAWSDDPGCILWEMEKLGTMPQDAELLLSVKMYKDARDPSEIGIGTKCDEVRSGRVFLNDFIYGACKTGTDLFLKNGFMGTFHAAPGRDPIQYLPYFLFLKAYILGISHMVDVSHYRDEIGIQSIKSDLINEIELIVYPM